MGDTLDKKGKPQTPGVIPTTEESKKSSEAEQREMLGQGTIENIRLPMLQEARN